ncbi:hypothetical protein, partial [Hallella sp.]|uniref:hypothetical protein n=1 Tax=Hallella sp. TaxID=2980186 RepID=UPI00307AB666
DNLRGGKHDKLNPFKTKMAFPHAISLQFSTQLFHQNTQQHTSCQHPSARGKNKGGASEEAPPR